MYIVILRKTKEFRESEIIREQRKTERDRDGETYRQRKRDIKRQRET